MHASGSPPRVHLRATRSEVASSTGSAVVDRGTLPDRTLSAVSDTARHRATERTQRPADRGPDAGRRRRRLALLGLGCLAALAAWLVLVAVSIDLGRELRAGDSGTWLVLAVALLGAVASLLAALLLGVRLRSSVREDSPARAPGRRRLER